MDPNQLCAAIFGLILAGFLIRCYSFPDMKCVSS